MKYISLMLFVLYTNFAHSAENKWTYNNYKDDMLSATIRPDSVKLKSFGLRCSISSKGKITLSAITRLAPTTPRKGKEGITSVTVEVGGRTLRYKMVNHASFPESIETINSIRQSVIDNIINGKELSFFWERWNGRLELEIISLQNSSVAITKLQKECAKLTP